MTMPISQSAELLETMRATAIDSGTVSTAINAGGNTLSDNTKRWATDIHKNMLVKIISGAGVGMQALIASNTANSIRIYTPWLGSIAAGDTYIIIGRDFYRDLIDALGGGIPISAANPLETHDPKVGSLISFEGTTTAIGGGGGINLVCAGLAALLADYDGLEVIITSGDYSGEARDINGTTLGGVVTPSLPFSGQILAGIDFVIAAVTTTPAEVAALTALIVALMADVGDASASTLGSIYAILGNPAQNFNTMVGYEGATSLANKLTAARAGYLDELAAANIPLDIDGLTAAALRNQGLCYYGVVTAAAAPSFTIPTLAGMGASKFITQYYVFVQRDAAGGVAPQGEVKVVTAYDTATGTFTTAAFTAAVAIGDEILIIHFYVYLAYINANNIQTGLKRVTLFKDQWCDPSTAIPSMAFSNAGADRDFPNVVIPADGTFITFGGAVIQSVYLMIKWRKMVESSAAPNAINAAAKTIRIKKNADAWGVSLVAVTMPNGGWSMPANAIEGGDVLIGSVDIKAKVSAYATTYNIRSDQTTTADAITVTGASITLYDVYAGLRIYYTLGY